MSGHLPLKIHKQVIVDHLRRHPERLREVFSEDSPISQFFRREFATVDEAVAFLAEHPGEWFVGGVLVVEH